MTTSSIGWLKSSVANTGQTYESIDLLFDDTKPEIFGRDVSMIVSCAEVSTNEKKGENCIHKLDIVASPSFSQAKLQVTHEVLPGQGACSQIVTVNSRLKVAGFDAGCIIPVSNYGPKKTFNCDVRGRLTHHHGAVNVVAANSRGDQIASGSVVGELALYTADTEQLSFLSRTSIGEYVTGLAYTSEGNDDTLVYSTLEGKLGIVDTRCKLAQEIAHKPVHSYHKNITSICLMSKRPGLVVYGGCASGEIFGLDLRSTREELPSPRPTNIGGCIRRVKEVLVTDTKGITSSFLVYTNQTSELQIFNAETMEKDERWTCHRLPNEEQRDFVQVGDYLISCGRQTSIGCWVWDSPKLN